MNQSRDDDRPHASGPRQRPLSQVVRGAIYSVLARSETFVASRNWVLKTVLLSIAFSIFISAGFDWRGVKAAFNETYEGNGFTAGYYLKIDHPLMDVAKISGKNSHDGNLNFRLSIPILLHVLGIRAHWVLPLLMVGATCAILMMSCLFAQRVTGDRVCGLLVCLGVASTYTGSFDVIAYFDTIAIALVAFAMMPGRHWLTKGVLVFVAAFTDERALVTSLFLLAQELWLSREISSLGQRLMKPGFLTVVWAMMLYAVCRILLMKLAGLSSPNGGNGPGAFVDHMRFWHAATWYALEGGWLLVGLALVALYQQRFFVVLAGFVLSILAVLCGGFMIGDILRSTAFVFPALFLALAVVSKNEELGMLRIYCVAACFISIIGGNYTVFLGEIRWFMPVPMVLLHKLLALLYAMIRPHLGAT